MNKLPTQEDIDLCLTQIGWDKVNLDNESVFLPIKGMELDFGGVVKEYAADCLAEIARHSGITHGLINLGGDIRVIGPQADGTPWQIAVVHPKIPDAAIATINLDSGALTTSGSYERFFEVEGNKYSHLINPVEGLLSVSIFAPLAVVAGSIASIASLHTENDGIAFLEQCQLAYLAIDQHLVSHGHLPSP
jgi:thiamine biosynthesis lipoprotein